MELDDTEEDTTSCSMDHQESGSSEWHDDHLSDLSDLPSALIVTNVPLSVFADHREKANFELIFTSVSGTPAMFEYFKSFKRVRVSFESPEETTLARLQCDNLVFRGSVLKCFFAQAVESPPPPDNGHLKLPELEKQFLISPPASPPVGWEQMREMEPVINFDLVARLAALAPVNAPPQEIHAASAQCPAIVVHTCDDSEEESMESKLFKPKIQHTRRPDV